MVTYHCLLKSYSTSKFICDLPISAGTEETEEHPTDCPGCIQAATECCEAMEEIAPVTYHKLLELGQRRASMRRRALAMR